MAEEISKKTSESRSEQIHILMPEHINGKNRLFGGRLMEWIDVVAAVAARRHCGRDVTTVFIDSLHFKAPAHVNETIYMTGQVTYVGNTSMEVRVDTYVEEMDLSRRMVNRAYLVMVALDEDEKPVRVPRLALETQEDKREWEAGAIRAELRKMRRKGDI